MTEPKVLLVPSEQIQLQDEHAFEEASSAGSNCNCCQELEPFRFKLMDSASPKCELLTQHFTSPAAHEMTALGGGFDERGAGNSNKTARARTDDAC